LVSDLKRSFVSDKEILVRFIFFRSWIRSNGTVKQDAFIPYPAVILSVTQSVDPEAEGIWEIGKHIESRRNELLHGRADVAAHEVLNLGLNVEPAPVADNPKHANVSGWPVAKHEQKMKAIEIASAAVFHRVP
jgi:hypothetical protein